VWIGCRTLADSGKELTLSTEVADTGTGLVEMRFGGRIAEKRKLSLCGDGSPQGDTYRSIGKLLE